MCSTSGERTVISWLFSYLPVKWEAMQCHLLPKAVLARPWQSLSHSCCHSQVLGCVTSDPTAR